MYLADSVFPEPLSPLRTEDEGQQRKAKRGGRDDTTRSLSDQRAPVPITSVRAYEDLT